MKNLAAFVVVLVGLMIGCCPSGQIIADDYLKADRATFNAIADEYDAYVDSDSKLDAVDKRRRKRTTATWKFRIEQAEALAPVTSETGE